MSRKHPRMPSSNTGARTKFLSHNPSHHSTLGDVGYVDDKGSWRKLVNVLDTESCEAIGIKSLRLARGLPQYITQARHAPFEEPIIHIDNEASHKLLTPIEAARYFTNTVELTCRTNYPELLDVNREGWSMRDRPSNRILLICPKPDATTTAFVAGPKIFVRTLHLPESTLRAWLNTYQSKIGKFARKMIDTFPPDGGVALICLSLRELFTETWRTAFIRADKEATPVALGWRASEEVPGAWLNLEMPRSTSVICGGFASYPVSSLPTYRLTV